MKIVQKRERIYVDGYYELGFRNFVFACNLGRWHVVDHAGGRGKAVCMVSSTDNSVLAVGLERRNVE